MTAFEGLNVMMCSTYRDGWKDTWMNKYENVYIENKLLVLLGGYILVLKYDVTLNLLFIVLDKLLTVNINVKLKASNFARALLCLSNF